VHASHPHKHSPHHRLLSQAHLLASRCQRAGTLLTLAGADISDYHLAGRTPAQVQPPGRLPVWGHAAAVEGGTMHGTIKVGARVGGQAGKRVLALWAWRGMACGGVGGRFFERASATCKPPPHWMAPKIMLPRLRTYPLAWCACSACSAGTAGQQGCLQPQLPSHLRCWTAGLG